MTVTLIATAFVAFVAGPALVGMWPGKRVSATASEQVSGLASRQVSGAAS